MIVEAARAALRDLEVEDVKVGDAVQHTASHDFDLDKWSIHFRRTGGEWFRVVLDTHYVHATHGQRNPETLTAEISRLFQEPNNHIPLQ